MISFGQVSLKVGRLLAEGVRLVADDADPLIGGDVHGTLPDGDRVDAIARQPVIGTEIVVLVAHAADRPGRGPNPQVAIKAFGKARRIFAGQPFAAGDRRQGRPLQHTQPSVSGQPQPASLGRRSRCCRDGYSPQSTTFWLTTEPSIAASPPGRDIKSVPLYDASCRMGPNRTGSSRTWLPSGMTTVVSLDCQPPAGRMFVKVVPSRR